MRVVVTGGSGLVGRYVVKELSRHSTGNPAYAITVFDLVRRRHPRHVTQVVGDHLNMSELLRCVDGADAVLHLSARQPTVPPSDEVFRTNVEGTKNVFEAASRCGVKKVVNWSSAWALGWSEPGNIFIPEYLPIDENHPLWAGDPYGRSKIEGEAIAESFHGYEGLEAVTLRPVYTARPATLAMLGHTNGTINPAYNHLAYVDVRDQARAARRALEIRSDSYISAYIAADDSRTSEPLGRLLPRLLPQIGDRADSLMGSQSSISNQRAKERLGWFPLYSWRRLSASQRARGFVEVNLRRAARKALRAKR